ncbi:hypothetical protein MXB_4804 [Myxobolus squamalis]|nr:hypothetical protein MXB_4804 [Myxobolus squamalis]
MTKMKTSFLVPSAQYYADAAIDTFEYTGKSHGCLTHHLIATILTLMPIHLLDFLVLKYTLQMKEKYDKWKRKTN